LFTGLLALFLFILLTQTQIMKKIFFIAALILISASSFAQIQSASLKASGLTCSMCSKSIFKSLQKVSFIQDVKVDIEGSGYELKFKPGSQVVIDDVKKAVEKAGFSVASMKVTANFPKTTIENDAHIALNGTNLHFLNVPQQTIQGEKTFTVVDKNFLPAKDNKKYSQYTKMTCFQTGMMAACCTKGSQPTGRIYHVTL